MGGRVLAHAPKVGHPTFFKKNGTCDAKSLGSMIYITSTNALG